MRQPFPHASMCELLGEMLAVHVAGSLLFAAKKKLSDPPSISPDATVVPTTRCLSPRGTSPATMRLKGQPEASAVVDQRSTPALTWSVARKVAPAVRARPKASGSLTP